MMWKWAIGYLLLLALVVAFNHGAHKKRLPADLEDGNP